MKRTLPSRWLAAIAIPIVLGSPRIGWACAVCSAGREDENRLAFLLTTIFLTVLPPVIVGGVVWWLRGRVRQMEAAAKPAISRRLQDGWTSGPAVARSPSSFRRVAGFAAWRSRR